MSVEFTPVFRNIAPGEDAAIFVDEIAVTMIMDGGKHQLFVRMSCVLEYTENKWLVIHFHASKPGETESDSWHVNEWKRRNEELAQLVTEKTAELEKKNSELLTEACLERVRTQAMGMSKPDDLLGICRVLFAELHTLGFKELRNAMINIHDDDAQSFLNYDFSRAAGPTVTTILYNSHPATDNLVKQIRRTHDGFAEFAIQGSELQEWRSYRKRMGEEDDPRLDSVDALSYYFYSIGIGAVGISTYSPIREEQRDILKRFRNVFNLSYQRYTDITLAETQAHEAQIEAAMEKVRGRAMAMHSSQDLAATTAVVYTELRRLGIGSVRCGVVLLSKSSRQAQLYATSSSLESDSLELIGSFELSGHASFEDQYQCWLNQENYFTTVSGEDLRVRYELLRSSLSVPYLARKDGEQQEHGYFFPFSEGQFYVWTREQYSVDEIAILSRFKTIVELTFRRYLDLQKAEAQAREAQIEASLERVRSRTLAMQKSDELAETAAVLFRQLIALGIAPNRLYIAIVKDMSGDAEFWITDEDGSKVSSGFAANLHANGSFQKMFEGWRMGKRSLTIDMQGKELQEYFQHLSSLNVPFKGGRAQLRRVQNVAFFSKGFIGIASPDEQPEETTLLLERFAAVFNLTLTRFNDLTLAEAQAQQAHRDLIQLQTEKKRAEDALTELRATQEQLVQQEKLASLGQLTAGIAHEIKNPLNFVNNFSAVSVELIDEAIEEMKTSSPELRAGEISQLLSDVKANLTKVIEHGTRADGIVKSMLHHSRGGSGKSEPTDLNALIKEYVNLAFHGMRAGKNPINVSIDFDLDESTGKALLVAEDFSRVIVNVCQNAFDAMREKVTAVEGGPRSGSYAPKLSIRSRRNAQRIAVEIEDNGPGIPEAIRDKVLQPFFTTKKGTQGTGLGLSITHDIIKAHRGEITIASNDSGGATFCIGLPAEATK
jgi:signal transduction histidine kinase